MNQLKVEIKKCEICKDFLPNSPNPIVDFSEKSKILIIGQAPGQVVDKKNIPFDDRSGDTLRTWMGVTRDQFYNTDNFAIVPMGFCYPGKGKTGGDAPPRKECAPKWHHLIFNALPHIELTLLIGKYAQEYYLNTKLSLTENVKKFESHLPQFFPLVHPSPLNFRWHSKNPWFQSEIVPILQLKVNEILKTNDY